MITALHQSVRRVWSQPGFVMLLMGNFALGSAYSLILPFLSLFGTVEVGMSPIVFGTFMTLSTLSGIVVSTVVAKWSDTHLTRCNTMILGGVGGLLGYFGYAFVRDAVGLTLLGVTLVALSQVNFSQIFAHGREEVSRDPAERANVPFYMSTLRMFFALAWTVGPAIGALIMIRFGYQGIFLGAALMFGMFLLIVLFYVPNRPHAPRAEKPPQLSLKRALTRPDIMAHFLAFTCIFAAHSMSMMSIPLLVTQDLGGTASQVGIIFGLAPVFELPLFMWFGLLAAKGHEVRLIRLGALFAIIYYGMLGWVEVPWQIYPLQVLSAASIAVTSGVAITFFQDLLPGQTGTATSIYTNSFSAGSLVGYFSFGLLLPVLGNRGVFGVCFGLTIITLSILLLAPRWWAPGDESRPA